jgi:uncharacterized protein YyaL (SSP411 family)
LSRLYDQSQLLQVYLDAYLIAKDGPYGVKYLNVVHDIATYLTTPPMQSTSGGFFSAEDADSLYRSTDGEKREGAFYVWTMKEFQTVLGDRDAEILAKYYNVQENGNVEPENGEFYRGDTSLLVSMFLCFLVVSASWPGHGAVANGSETITKPPEDTRAYFYKGGKVLMDYRRP